MKKKPMILTKHILLCGFMGAGKSTVGRLLGERLCLRFVDTDLLIVTKYQKSIAEIFSSLGEKKFREYEHGILSELLTAPPSVIAAGGGILSYEKNLALLPHALTICLMPDFDTIFQRIRGDESRPLLLHKNAEEVRALYEARKPIYLRCAEFTTKNSSSPDECVEEILAYLHAEPGLCKDPEKSKLI